MEYIVTIENKGAGQLQLHKEVYNRTLDDLHKACNCDTIMIYRTDRMLPWIQGIEGLLIVCDDNGKVFYKDPTMPIYNDHGDMVDVFVGDLAFIKTSTFDPSEDVGLDDVDCELLIHQLKLFYSQFKLPKLNL